MSDDRYVYTRPYGKPYGGNDDVTPGFVSTVMINEIRRAFDGGDMAAKNVALRKAADMIELLTRERDTLLAALTQETRHGTD